MDLNSKLIILVGFLLKLVDDYYDMDIFNHIDLITGGDDYELLYTIDPKDEKLIDANSFIIGKIISGNKINLYSKDKNLIDVNKIILGYEHF